MNDASSRRLETDQTSSPGDLTPRKPAGSGDLWWLFAVGLIAVALCLPFTLFVWWLGDEGVILHGAERMLRGDRIYLDFFEFLPPGSFAITAIWFKVAGISLTSARALAIVTAAGTACFTYLACRQASKHAPTSAFIAVGWVVLTQGNWTEVNHQWFTTLFAIVAAWGTFVGIEHPQRWLRWPLTAGIVAGAGAMVTPNRGALVMLAAATPFANMRRYWRELIVYLLGAALVPTCMFAYLVWQGALTAAFEDVILFTVKHYTSIQRVHFGFEAIFPLKWLFPLVALLTLLTCIRGWRNCLQDRLLQACAAFALAGFIGCFPRPDRGHLSYAVASVCPLLAYCLRQLTTRWQSRYQYAVAAVAIGFLFPGAELYAQWARIALHREIVRMPRGRVMLAARLDPLSTGELGARIAATPSGDPYFFYPYDAMLPFLTARRQASKYDVFTPGYTLSSQYKEACISAMRSASWVVIDRTWTDPKFLTANFPAMRDPEPEETKRFERALERGFELVAREGSFELRHRVRAVDDSVCAGITDGSTR
jgi:hypothetical protein